LWSATGLYRRHRPLTELSMASTKKSARPNPSRKRLAQRAILLVELVG
jgi:hypothetical protein